MPEPASGTDRAARPLEAGSERILEITDLAFGGRGVARLDGFVIFVAGALPGESVRARVERVRAGFAEATCLQVLRPSPDRVEPRCPHYAICGGCDLQHLGEAAQARAKGEQVRALLQRLAGLREVPLHETLRAGEAWSYRFRMEFDWGRDEAGKTVLGLHRRARPGVLFAVEQCQVLPEPGNELIAFLAREAQARGLAAWDGRLRHGLLRRAAMQLARGSGEVLLTLETARGHTGPLQALARDLLRRFPRCVGVVRRELDKAGHLVEESILAGRDHLFEEVEGDRLAVSAGSFFQPNRHGVGPLRRLAVGALGPRPEESILELYAGVGLFTLELARRAREVTAVEGSRAAAFAARTNAARAGLGNVTVVCREVSAALSGLLLERAWGGVLLDPPRAGLPAESARALAEAGPGRLVYVSCDPATLSRDLKILAGAGRYGVDAVTPCDLFPQTHHVECVVSLSRRG